jgi:hypothetical protein|tara:strand:+ start:133 stop:510 length:378 start_codon:yes stop_codon:yes gene_type:complete
MNDMSQISEIDRCQPWIEAALEYSGGTHSLSDVINGITSGKMQLWPSPKGCIVTEIVVYPRKKMLNVFLGGGEMEQLLDMHKDVIAWSKAQGCEAITITGRFGWKKPLTKHGWKPMHASFIKEIE